MIPETLDLRAYRFEEVLIMGNLPLHPVIVHLPMALSVLVPLVAIGVVVAIHRGLLPRRAWWIAVVFQAALVGSAALAMRTGEGEEERVEHRISESAIERHEEKAEQFLWVAGLTLLLAGAALPIPSERVARQLMTAAVVATLATAGMGVRVGHAGGELVYGPKGLTQSAIGR